jgi:hypothetical protein
MDLLQSHSFAAAVTVLAITLACSLVHKFYRQRQLLKGLVGGWIPLKPGAD